MQRVGPRPAPVHAVELAAYAVDRVLCLRGEDAAHLVRCLRRYEAAIEAERVAAVADPASDPAVVAAWDAADPHGATWGDVLRHVEERVQDAAMAVHGHRLDFGWP
jgi:hypothetical protein